MAIVSISEASKLVAKSRRTIQRHIAQGKLSKVTDATGSAGVDTSELIRVYGVLTIDDMAHDEPKEMSQADTSEKDTEIQHLKEIIAMQKDHIESLKSAMLLLEHKESDNHKKAWWSRFFN